MVLAFGAVFQMPVIVFVLARFGIVTAHFLWVKGKYAILIIFIVAAVASPGTDVVSQMMMAAPMILLYGMSIVVAWLFGKKRKPATV
jgi:sec-independent protein translocase protein TatC